MVGHDYNHEEFDEAALEAMLAISKLSLELDLSRAVTSLLTPILNTVDFFANKTAERFAAEVIVELYANLVALLAPSDRVFAEKYIKMSADEDRLVRMLFLISLAPEFGPELMRILGNTCGDWMSIAPKNTSVLNLVRTRLHEYADALDTTYNNMTKELQLAHEISFRSRFSDLTPQ